MSTALFYGAGKQTVAAVGGQLLALGLVPILTRLAPPDVFGGYAPFLALSVLGSVVGLGRVEQITLIATDDADLRSVTCFIVAGALSGGVVVGVIAVTAMGRDIGEAACAGAMYLLTLVQRGWMVRAVRDGRHGRIAAANLAEVAGTLVLQVLLLSVAVPGVTALITGRAAALLVGSVLIAPPATELRRLFGDNRLRELVRRYRRVIGLDLPGSLANTLSWQSPVLFIAFYWGAESAGIYTMSYRLLRMPNRLLGVPASRAFTSELMERGCQPGFVGKFTLVILAAGLLIYGSLVLMPSALLADMLRGLLGDAWGEAAAPMRILAPWLGAAFATSHLGVVFLKTEGLRLLLGFNVALLATRVAALASGAAIGDFTTTLWLLSLSGLAMYAVLYPLTRKSMNSDRGSGRDARDGAG
jgi:O-antigen/teichoic acid export membrane protein